MANVTDPFSGGDASPLPSPWEIIVGDGHQVLSGAAAAVDATGATVSAWAASHTNFTDNQLARVTLSAFGVADFPGCAVRALTTGGGQGYALRWNGVELVLYKLTAGTFNYLADWAATVAGTDNFELEADGDGTSTSLIVRHNGTIVDTYVDSTSPHTGGQPGIYYDYQNSNASRITTFYAEDDAGGGVTTISRLVGGKLVGGLLMRSM